MRPNSVRARLTPPVAAALLLLRGWGGGALVLAHAVEAPTAPATLEVPHHADCVVVHDAPGCTLCQMTGPGLAPRDPRPGATGDLGSAPRATPRDASPARRPAHRATASRAPPALPA
jgi:hypothetical protein